MFKKLLFIVLFSFGLIWTYYWYVRGIKLLLSEDDQQSLPPYGAFAVRLPEKTPPGPRWEAAAPMPAELAAVEAAVIGDTIFVVGGLDALGRSVADVRAFDTKKNSWSQRASLPKPLQHVALAAYGGRLYAFGGFSGVSETPNNSVFIYDASVDSWRAGRNLPQPVGGASAAVVGDAIHVLGGFSKGQSSDLHYVYNPAKDGWRISEALITGRDRAAVLVHDGMVYVFGGRQGSILYPIADTTVYSPGNDNWEDIVHMPLKRANGAAAEVAGKAYLLCGENTTVTIGQVDMFDFASRTWSRIADLPTSRQGCAVAAVGNRIFVIGGGRQPVLSVSDVNEVFVP